jgi:hypothetical protein
LHELPTLDWDEALLRLALAAALGAKVAGMEDLSGVQWAD